MAVPPAGRKGPSGQKRAQPPDGQRVALHPASRDHALGAERDVGVVAEAFTLVDVRDVHLDHWPLERVQRVEDRDGGVGEGAGVDDDAGGPVPRLVDPVDQLALVVGLLQLDLVPGLRCDGGAGGGDVVQRLVAVDFGLAATQEVQVGSVQDKDRAHAASCGVGPRSASRRDRRQPSAAAAEPQPHQRAPHRRHVVQRADPQPPAALTAAAPPAMEARLSASIPAARTRNLRQAPPLIGRQHLRAAQPGPVAPRPGPAGGEVGQRHVQPLRADRRHDMRRLGHQRHPLAPSAGRRGGVMIGQTCRGEASFSGPHTPPERSVASASNASALVQRGQAAAPRPRPPSRRRRSRGGPSRSGRGTSVKGPPERWISVETFSCGAWWVTAKASAFCP